MPITFSALCLELTARSHSLISVLIYFRLSIDASMAKQPNSNTCTVFGKPKKKFSELDKLKQQNSDYILYLIQNTPTQLIWLESACLSLNSFFRSKIWKKLTFCLVVQLLYIILKSLKVDLILSCILHELVWLEIRTQERYNLEKSTFWVRTFLCRGSSDIWCSWQ